MEICPRCGKVMALKKSSKPAWTCFKCGYERPIEGSIIYTKVHKRGKTAEIAVVDKEEEAKVLPVTTDVVCPKCGAREAYYWSIQTRSADEPMTQFFRCRKCGHTWREYV
ncbi:MAG: transcription factor S [Nitrososphaerota archaeon]|nr:transcription factor S [Nitrososphaerota archaeon]